MPWYAWILVADIIVSALFKVGTVDQPRDPVSGTDAVAAVIGGGLYAYVVLHLGGVV